MTAALRAGLSRSVCRGANELRRNWTVGGRQRHVRKIHTHGEQNRAMGFARKALKAGALVLVANAAAEAVDAPWRLRYPSMFSTNESDCRWFAKQLIEDFSDNTVFWYPGYIGHYVGRVYPHYSCGEHLSKLGFKKCMSNLERTVELCKRYHKNKIESLENSLQLSKQLRGELQATRAFGSLWRSQDEIDLEKYRKELKIMESFTDSDYRRILDIYIKLNT